jgi:hypothetical protein
VSLAVTLAWIVLLLIHAAPALAAFSPRLRKRMYGVEENGVLGIILAHRGFLFLAVAAACAYAAFDTPSRPLATIVTAISVLGFLALYGANGSPMALRQIALTDLIGVPPLALVSADAFALF